MLVMTAVCGILMPRVGVNSDMTKYLPSSSQMKKGLDLLEKDFPATGAEYTVRIMFCGLTDAQKAELKSSLAAIKNVDSVNYETDSADYNNGEYTLFVLKTGFAYDSDEMAELEKRWRAASRTTISPSEMTTLPHRIFLLRSISSL